MAQQSGRELAPVLPTTRARHGNFRDIKTLQKFAFVHNNYNLERHFVSRKIYKLNRSVALAEWR
jgi:hypothetical protein